MLTSFHFHYSPTVSLSVHGGGENPRVTITHDALDFIIHGPLDMFKLFNLELTVQGSTGPSPPVQGSPSPIPTWTCSNLFIINHVRLASRQLASYWNVFFLPNRTSVKQHPRMAGLFGWGRTYCHEQCWYHIWLSKTFISECNFRGRPFRKGGKAIV